MSADRRSRSVGLRHPELSFCRRQASTLHPCSYRNLRYGFPARIHGISSILIRRSSKRGHRPKYALPSRRILRRERKRSGVGENQHRHVLVLPLVPGGDELLAALEQARRVRTRSTTAGKRVLQGRPRHLTKMTVGVKPSQWVLGMRGDAAFFRSMASSNGRRSRA